jgi:hypothetical protein
MRIPEILIIPDKTKIYAVTNRIAPAFTIDPKDVKKECDNGKQVYHDVGNEIACTFPRWFQLTEVPLFVPGEMLFRSISNFQNKLPQVVEVTPN